MIDHVGSFPTSCPLDYLLFGIFMLLISKSQAITNFVDMLLTISTRKLLTSILLAAVHFLHFHVLKQHVQALLS